MRNFMIMILALFLLSGCKGEDGSDGADLTGLTPATVTNPSGKIETAFCKKGTIVWATSVDAAWTQTGALSGEVKTNDGSYVVRGNFEGPFISFLVPNGTCFSEANNAYVNNVILRGMEQAGATVHNKNYATSLEYYLAEDHFFDSTSTGYGSIPAAFPLAKSEILDYFNFPAMSKGFNELSVVGDTIGDAYLLALETYITDAGTGPDQYNRVAELAIAILDGDLSYRATIRQFVEDIEVKRVTDNIKNERVVLGFSAEVAPLWELPFYPDYYRDLMVRTPVELASKNKTQTSTGGTGLSTYSLFQYPVRFTGVEGSKYIALDIDNGDISIWTKGGLYNGYEIRGTKIIDLERLNEVLLPGGLKANYSLGESHGLVSGVDYILIQSKPTPSDQWTLTIGDPVPFSQNSASDDGGLTWLPANITGRFTTSIKWVLFD